VQSRCKPRGDTTWRCAARSPTQSVEQPGARTPRDGVAGACSCMRGRPSITIVVLATRKQMFGVLSGSACADVERAGAGVSAHGGV
jgi:hypothetical protein